MRRNYVKTRPNRTLLLLGGLLAIGFTALMVREYPSMKREWLLMSM